MWEKAMKLGPIDTAMLRDGFVACMLAGGVNSLNVVLH
jgi:hypothetical protein